MPSRLREAGKVVKDFLMRMPDQVVYPPGSIRGSESMLVERLPCFCLASSGLARPMDLTNTNWAEEVERLPPYSFTEEMADALRQESLVEGNRAYQLASTVVRGLARNGNSSPGQIKFWLGWALCEDEQWEAGLKYLGLYN